VCITGIGCLFAVTKVIGALIESCSFSVPFDQHDARGARRVPGFKVDGDASVLSNFLRLTPDKQNQRGYVESVKTFSGEQLSFSLKFRISGTGDVRESGDALGVWITSTTSQLDGPIYGMPSSFKGIGIIVDSSRIGLHQGKHKDVRLLINDGTRDEDDLLRDSVGCSATFRFSEDRDDFNVGMLSKLRFSIGSNGNLALEVDTRNLGRWRTCLQVGKTELPEGFLRDARISLVGKTTTLHNNQDVLSFEVYDTLDGAFSDAAVTAEEEIDKIDLIVHRLEHDLFAVRDKIQSALALLEEKEVQSEERILVLENRLSEKFGETLQQRISKLEREFGKLFTSSLMDRLQTLEKKFQGQIAEKVNKRISDASRLWQWPFAILLISILAILGFFYKTYRQIRKSHLL